MIVTRNLLSTLSHANKVLMLPIVGPQLKQINSNIWKTFQEKEYFLNRAAAQIAVSEIVREAKIPTPLSRGSVVSIAIPKKSAEIDYPETELMRAALKCMILALTFNIAINIILN